MDTNIDIKKSFFRYVSLSILGLIGISCYILADTYFIAKGEGNLGLAALNVAIPAFNFMNATGLMIGIGGATKYSITKKNSVFVHSFVMALFFAVIFFVLGAFFPYNLSRLLGANDDVLNITATYIRILLCFSPFFMLNNLFMAFVRNDENPRLVSISMTCGSIFNIIFDYIFIFPMGLGMLGAALATGFSPAISLLIMSLHKIKNKNTFHLKYEKIHLKMCLSIASLGISSFITEFANGIVVLIFNIIILDIKGNTGVAAYGVITNIAMVIMALFNGLSQGMQPLLSLEYGKGNLGNVKKLYNLGVVFSLCMATVVYLLLFVFSNPIIDLFNSEKNQALSSIANTGIHLYFLAFFFTGINIVKSSYYSAIGNAKNGFIISILRGFLIIIPTVFILSYLFSMNGVWLSLLVTDFIVFIFTMLLMR